jgi:serine/threonine protein kinase
MNELIFKHSKSEPL